MRSSKKFSEKLESKYPFGSKKVQSFTFTGIDLNQHGDGRITLSQSGYVRKISPIPIDVNRKSPAKPEGNGRRTRPFKRFDWFPSICCHQHETRPSKQAIRTAVSNQSMQPLRHFGDANRLLHEAKKYHDMTLTIRPIPPWDFRFMAFLRCFLCFQ